MGVLAGTTVFGHSPSADARDEAVRGINSGDLQGLVMTDRVGGCGHNLTGANVMVFMGSLYSGPYEEQAIGSSQFLPKSLIVGRICRPNQTRLCKIYIIADPRYEGDRMAFEIKNSRNKEGELMKCRLDKKKGHFRCMQMVHSLLDDDEVWEEWKANDREYKAKQATKNLK